jgi:hypothetical protein
MSATVRIDFTCLQVLFTKFVYSEDTFLQLIPVLFNFRQTFPEESLQFHLQLTMDAL